MENKEIVCVIDMFAAGAEIIYPNNDRENVPAEGVIEYLYQACKDEDVYNLHICGNKQYIEGLLEQYPPLDYGCGKVAVKVN